MRRLVNQRDELLRLRLTRQKSDSAAIAHAQSRSDSFVELERDVLLRKEVNEPIMMLADFPGDVALELRQVSALGLRNILSRDSRPGF
jgi:hypothetical protein